MERKMLEKDAAKEQSEKQNMKKTLSFILGGMNHERVQLVDNQDSKRSN